jgi:nicotinamidase-related amidase
MDRFRHPLFRRAGKIDDAMTTVLVALHYQNEVMHAAGKIRVGVAEDGRNRDDLQTRARELLAFARSHDIPVVSVRIAFRPDHADVVQNCRIFRNVVAGKAMIEGSWGTEFHDGLGPVGDEFVVKHTRVNAFYGSQLAEVLEILGAERLIFAGVSSTSVVITTVAAAADMGFEVIVVEDASSAADPALHDAAMEMMRLVADVVTVKTLESALAR